MRCTAIFFMIVLGLFIGGRAVGGGVIAPSFSGKRIVSQCLRTERSIVLAYEHSFVRDVSSPVCLDVVGETNRSEGEPLSTVKESGIV